MCNKFILGKPQWVEQFILKIFGLDVIYLSFCILVLINLSTSTFLSSPQHTHTLLYLFTSSITSQSSIHCCTREFHSHTSPLHFYFTRKYLSLLLLSFVVPSSYACSISQYIVLFFFSYLLLVNQLKLIQ